MAGDVREIRQRPPAEEEEEEEVCFEVVLRASHSISPRSSLNLIHKTGDLKFTEMVKDQPAHREAVMLSQIGFVSTKLKKTKE